MPTNRPSKKIEKPILTHNKRTVDHHPTSESPNHRPKKRTKANKENHFLTRIRTDSKKEVVVDDGNLQPKKTAVLLNTQTLNLTPQTTARVKSVFDDKVKDIKTNRPVLAPLNSSPNVLLTPGGTKLVRRGKNGLLYHFSNQSPEKKPQTVLFDVKNNSAFKKIKPNATPIKYQAIEITAELLQEVRKEYKMNNSRRKVSQNKVMADEGVSQKQGSASNYVSSAQSVLDNQRWEWLHLIAHRFLGSEAQDDKNLGAGTKHSNTEMMLVENEVAALSKKYPEGFEIKIVGKFRESTQILEYIDYTIVTKDFILPFRFDAQKVKIPNFEDKDYIKALFETMNELQPQKLTF